MGTTLTALLRAGSRFGLVHVGDSRGYLLRDGELQQITHDHTFVQTLVDEGRITAEEADHHPQRNLITSALDGREDVELDLSVREARAGDRYLLCSDGLSGVVSEETLRETLAAEASTDVAVEQLVELALRGGGPDNITAIVADVVEVETKPPSAVPVTVGAAAEGAVKHDRTDTPAAKAAALRPAPEDEDARRSRTRARRTGTAAVGCCCCSCSLLAVSAPAATVPTAGRRPSTTSGPTATNVAIYRGLSQDVGPVRTSRLYRHEDVALADLPAYQQERVRADIATDGLADATHIVGTLRDQAELCRDAAHRHAHARRRVGPGSLGHRDARPDGDTQPDADAHADRHRRRRRERLRDRAVTARTASRSRSPRTIELVLLVFSVGDRRWPPTPRSAWPTTARCPPGCSGTAAGWPLLFGAAHLALRRLAPDADPVMLPARHAASTASGWR